MSFRKYIFISLLLILLVYSFPVLASDNRGVEITPVDPSYSAHLGNYHALIIGINKYKEWNTLRTAVKDAEELKDILIKRYGFKKDNVILRTDRSATRDRLIGDLRNMASGLGNRDNLLIYFAGHGQLDDLTGDGYWIPTEGKLKKPSSWISHSTIKNILSSERVRGKNIIIVADSCYSGTLLRGGPSLLSINEQGYRGKLLKLASNRSRQVITSGGLEPVADGGRDGHSLFGYYFLKALKDNDKDLVDLESLFHTRVWRYVTEIGDQRPNVGRLKTPMDEDGQFVLASSGAIVEEPAEGKNTLSVESNVSGARVRILNIGPKFYQGMELDTGSYHVEVSADGYKTKKKWITLGSGQDKNINVRLEKRIVASVDPDVSKPKVITRDGRFVKNNNGIVYDYATGLEWIIGPDKNTTWNEAKSWVEKLLFDGGGWRMPTFEELKNIYNNKVGTHNITPLLETTGWLVWSGETMGSSNAWLLDFSYGKVKWNTRSASDDLRVFAVRPRK